MLRFMVTGGAGFIGSNLSEMLLVKGHSVTVFDNLATGREENLSGIISRIDFIRGDIRDKEALEAAMKGMDYVIHLAALGSVPRSIEDPATTHEVNATGTLNVLNAARSAEVKRVVCASSSSVYGDTAVLPKEEQMTPSPLSPYAVSKITGEYYCKAFHRVYGLETVSLRYFNVYGRRQDPNSQYAAVIPRFVDAMLRGKSPVIYGDGEQSRDFTFVDDCNQANIKACFASGCEGMHFNVGYGSKVSINDLFGKIRDSLGSKVEPAYAPPRKGDVRDSLAAISRAKELLGYEPENGIDEGIRKTVRWYLESYGKLAG
ncbi:MAG: SDR family oxidoreductase [Candidatus Methylomirabilis sp.]|nr:SDR family oxidoreductase [Deltaproteobacteria bacterium]